MKTNFLILAAASLGLAAQTHNGELSAKVPFPFEMNGKQMPAGDYKLRYSADRPYASMSHLDSGNGFLFAVRKTSGVQMDRSVLIFSATANRYVLTAIGDKANSATMQLPTSRSAAEIAKAEVSRIAVVAAE